MSTAVITASWVSALFMRAVSEASKISDNLFYSEGYLTDITNSGFIPEKGQFALLDFLTESTEDISS